ncbi:MAG: hypothetical protein AAF415_02140 [Pseudomonadota bacterium]
MTERSERARRFDLVFYAALGLCVAIALAITAVELFGRDTVIGWVEAIWRLSTDTQIPISGDRS